MKTTIPLHLRTATAVFTLVIFSACGTTNTTNHWVGIPTGTTKLLGPINPVNGSNIHGAGSLFPSDVYTGTHAIVSISGGDEGRQYSWKLRQGYCDAPGTTIGEEKSYPEFVPEADGNASVEVVLPFRVDMKQGYSIAVSESPAASNTIACGDLLVTKPAGNQM